MMSATRLARRRRATVARCLLAADPVAAATIDWTTLADAPEWFGFDDEELQRFSARVGALLQAASVRMWIDGSRLAAARAAVGAPFLQALLALPDSQLPMPRELSRFSEMGDASQVGTALRRAGQSVLLTAAPVGVLRNALQARWRAVEPSLMAEVLARSLVGRASTLVAARAASGVV